MENRIIVTGLDSMEHPFPSKFPVRISLGVDAFIFTSSLCFDTRLVLLYENILVFRSWPAY